MRPTPWNLTAHQPVMGLASSPEKFGSQNSCSTTCLKAQPDEVELLWHFCFMTQRESLMGLFHGMPFQDISTCRNRAQPFLPRSDLSSWFLHRARLTVPLPLPVCQRFRSYPLYFALFPIQCSLCSQWQLFPRPHPRQPETPRAPHRDPPRPSCCRLPRTQLMSRRRCVPRGNHMQMTHSCSVSHTADPV